MERGESIAPGVMTLRSDLVVNEDGFVEVEIRAEVSEKLLAALKRMKAKIQSSHPDYRSITASVPLSEIEALAERPDIIFIQPKQEAIFWRQEERSEVRFSAPPAGKNNLSRPASFLSFAERAENIRDFLSQTLTSDRLAGRKPVNGFVGSVLTEADVTHRVGIARTITGADGTGIKIGVISDGVASLATSQANGEQPPTVTVLPGQAGSGNEGTAILELVHDLVPGAQLYFATALPSAAAFAQNIRDLRLAGCDIIIDDVSYFVETPFQDGQAPSVVSPTNAGVAIQAVNDVTVGSLAGALYFSSAGNSGNKNDNESGVWEGDFVDGGAAGGVLAGAGRLHNFGSATYNTLTANGRVLLKWSDPLGASGNDYDMYILNSAGTSIVRASTNVQDGNDDPVEDAGNCFANERIVIVRYSGSSRFLHLNTNRGRLAISTSGVVFGHNASSNSISVGATPAGPASWDGVTFGPYPFAHNSSNVVEPFSSDGPRRIFYYADGTPITPGNVSSTGGMVLQKPDITAADGSSTTVPGFTTFFGTSASAPQAGAIAALIKSAIPTASRTDIYNALTTTAIDIEAPGWDRDSGAGIVMPIPAMASLGVSGLAYLERTDVIASEISGNGNGSIDPTETIGLSISLENIGLANATSVSATLSSTTPGVLVLPETATRSYPDLAMVNGNGTNTLPYVFMLAGNMPCGTVIDFTLTVNYVGGTSPQVMTFSLNTGTPLTISTTLDTTAPPSGAGYTASTGLQSGRIFRDNVTASCAIPKTNPGLNPSDPGARRYDLYRFTASTSGCINVRVTGGGTTLHAVAYDGFFNPTNPSENFLADYGLSSDDMQFSFNVVANQPYAVVVHEVSAGVGIGRNYTLSITGPIAGTCGAVTAAGVSVGGRVFSNTGLAVANAVVTMVSPNGEVHTARTNPFGYYLFENVPAGADYVFSIDSKRFQFAPRSVFVGDNITDLNFTALP